MKQRDPRTDQEIFDRDMALIKVKAGDTCRCGSGKKQGHSFCFDCYFMLPVDVKEGLEKPFGKGYQQAYADALEILDEREVAW